MAAASVSRRWWRATPSIGNIGISNLALAPTRKMPFPATCVAALRRPAPSASMMAMASSLTSSGASSKSNGGNRQQMMESGISRILTDEQRSLFHRVNQLSAMTRSLARQVGNVAIKEDGLLADITRIQTQKRPRRQTSTDQERKINESTDVSAPPSLFTVVFAGEFNSGKSTLINALLGNELLDTGVLPTTDTITVVMANGDDADPNDDEGTSPLIESGSFASDDSAVPVHTQLHLLSASDFPILSDLCLIDTPGTNAILSLQHTSSTLRILHDADLIVFVTSADRPFSESERQLLQTSIKLYRKRVVLVINKMDVLERQKGEDHGESTKKRVEEYVVEHASDLLGARPVVIPLSARDALSMKLLYNSHRTSNDGPGSAEYQPSLWTRSNFGALEHL
jgi:small GTP-binding protein